MYRILSIVLFIISSSIQVRGQSPHGDALKMECAVCHDPSGWTTLKKELLFKHDSTNFALEGSHISVDCKACHHSLVFTEASTQCNTCHTDVHAMSLGNDCARCHTSQNWMVDQLPELHEESGFPLLGAHSNLSCTDCHTSETNLRFDRIGNDCFNCHKVDYLNTVNPNHQAAGFSTNCLDCHDPITNGWNDDNFSHDFFPLTAGHNIQDCKECHTTGNFSDASPNCVSCHLDDFNHSTNPDHSSLELSIDCKLCHDETGWTPSSFSHTGFPLLGAHASITSCDLCHHGAVANTPNTCESCHIPDYNTTTNPDHPAAQISTDCKLCHDETAWTPSNLDHSLFPFVGAHAPITNDCNQCHHGNYTNTPNTCNGCHMPDYNNSTDPDHAAAQISTDCKLCHDETAWLPSTLDHSLFPFVGAHAPIANDCNQCHHGNYTNTPNTCDGCHMPDYNNTSNPNHVVAQLSTDCKLCHAESAWIPSVFTHSNFPLVGAHAAITDCNLCHHGNFTTTPNTCNGCHQTDYNNTLNPDHAAAQLSTDCQLCHDATAWIPSTLDHSLFPFVGAHAPIANDCNLCHHGNYTNTPNTCEGCHQTDYNNTSSPNHTVAQLSTDCRLCHDESAWTPSTLDHSLFPLVGGHAQIANDCNLCHHGNYTNTPNTCEGCHMPDYNNTANPNHSVSQLPTNCNSCHDETAWIPSTFDHSIYPFVGAHAPIANDCNLCHNGNYINTPNTCNGCHMPDYNTTSNPNHLAAQFPTDCALCHTESAWIPSGFTHSSFPLLGAHASITDCNDCHHSNYTNTPNTCNGCHMPDYTATTNPNHSSAQISTDCAVCHNESAWIPANFAHTSFPLIGAHASVSDCNDCHHGNYTSTPNTCNGCHMPDYTATTNPNHSTSQISTDCAVCHNESAWIPATFTHTAFPLLGAHATVTDCNDCHHGNYTNTPNTCNACHMPDYTATTNPNHSTAQFPTDCAVCHNETAWIPSGFNHNSFPLLGAHAAISSCNDCHQGNYTNTPNTCVGCHMPDYSATTNPNHTASQISTDCAVCHTESAWIPANFAHTAFPLLGAHAAVTDCNLCHHGNYTNTPSTCNACHMPDYTATTNPNHSAAQFPTDCAACHNETAWIPSGFNHSSFPIVGAHTAITNCNDCHQGNYTNTPNTCAGCHMPDYNATTNPNHNAAQFSTNCTSCHNESAWTPSSFNHDSQYFPIYSGKHNGEWNSCTDCHTNSGNYAVFSCINCHEHNNQNSVNNDHNGVSGYSYNSNACYSCHPDGRS